MGGAGRSALCCLLGLVARCWAACEKDWYPFKQWCYAAFAEPVSWDDAQSRCESLSSQLVSIHSEEENDHVMFTCGNQRPFEEGCWIGGTDRNQKHRKWKWLDGDKWAWSKWMDHGGGNSEPNNDFCSNHRKCTYGTTADCAHLEISRPFRGFWLDTFCTSKMKYVCKKAGDGTVAARQLLGDSISESSVAPEAQPPTPVQSVSDQAPQERQSREPAAPAPPSPPTATPSPQVPPPTETKPPPAPAPPPPPPPPTTTPSPPPPPPTTTTTTATPPPAPPPPPPPPPPAPPKPVAEPPGRQVPVEPQKQAARAVGEVEPEAPAPAPAKAEEEPKAPAPVPDAVVAPSPVEPQKPIPSEPAKQQQGSSVPPVKSDPGATADAGKVDGEDMDDLYQ